MTSLLVGPNPRKLVPVLKILEELLHERTALETEAKHPLGKQTNLARCLMFKYAYMSFYKGVGGETKHTNESK